MAHITILPLEIEETIIQIIAEKYNSENLEIAFPNKLLREDVLDLLDKYCTVVYYPLVNEENNGFRLKDMPFSDGSFHNFVFINTAQTMDKQIFTAAHELGHIWNVDEFVIRMHNLNDSQELREQIINRFAAALLIPNNIFGKAISIGLEKLRSDKERAENSISYMTLSKLIAFLMNYFFTPMKAIVLRLVELGYFPLEIVNVILGHNSTPAEEFKNLVDEFCRDFGYTKLLTPSNKKWIEGLSEMLEIAEQTNLISKNKIRVMREKFDLQPASSTTPAMHDVISLGIQEGNGT